MLISLKGRFDAVVVFVPANVSTKLKDRIMVEFGLGYSEQPKQERSTTQSVPNPTTR
jgi:hypothetical protein